MTDGFLPDPVRTAGLAARIVAQLEGSLGGLADACGGAGACDAAAMRAAMAGLCQRPRVPAVAFLRYHAALDAARRDDPEALAAALAAVCEADGAAPLAVRGYGDASLDAGDWVRLGEAMGGAAGDAPLEIGPVEPALLGEAAGLLAQARAAIAMADGQLAGEIDALVSEVVFASPRAGAGRDFGGATSFRAWGAIVLNPRRHGTMIAMAAGLVHEAAHALLMALSFGAPMVENDAAERYGSPLRSDLRPMDGIFHAAFVSARIVYAMDRLLLAGGLAQPDLDEALQLRAASCAAFEAGHAMVAAHGRPTPAGAAAMKGAVAYMRGRPIAGAGADHDAAILARAEACYQAGDPAAAAGLLAPLAERADAAAAVLRMLGLCRLRLGRVADGVALLARAHSASPGDPWCRLHYAIGLQSAGRHAEAAALFRACQALLPCDPAPWLNLSSSLLAMGDVQGAIKAARRGRARCPADRPQAHYVLGVACLEAGQVSRAAECFRQAVRHAPNFADGWVNLGVARYREGRMEAAKQAMRAALAADPGHAAALANLGSFLQLTGEVDASEALLKHAVTRGPAPAARINLAASLLQEDRAAEALDVLAAGPHATGLQLGSTPPERQLAQHTRLQQVLALIKLGRLAEARVLLDELGEVPASLASLLHWRRVLLAKAEGDLAMAARHAAAMDRALDGTASLLPEHRIMGHYDLAKHYSQAGDSDAAFRHWGRGHTLLRRFQPFSRAAYGAFVDATIERFDLARFTQGARAGNADAAPVFVVGMPRSGTTLMEQILSAHAGVHGAGERCALAMMAELLGGAVECERAPARIAALGGARLDEAGASYLAALHALAPGASRIVDKMPGNFRHLGLVGLMLPGARVIACERDPRDIGLSIFTFRFYGSHGYAHDLSDLGWYIAQQRRLMDHWRRVLPNPILTVRLADWVEDFTGTLRRVLDFLDLPYDAACEQFHMAERRVRTVSRTQVKEKVNARGLGRWRAYEAQLAPLTAALREAGALVVA